MTYCYCEVATQSDFVRQTSGKMTDMVIYCRRDGIDPLLFLKGWTQRNDWGCDVYLHRGGLRWAGQPEQEWI